MGRRAVIGDVTDALVRLIQSRTADLGGWVAVHSLSNADSAPAANTLAFALIAIEEHDHLRNRPLVQTVDGYQRAPMALRLLYLVSYVGPHDEAQIRLSRVLRVFHTTPILGPGELPPALAERVGRVTVRLRTTTSEERSNVWAALGRPARLALFYEVDVAPIDLLDDAESWGRVQTHRIDYVSKP